MRESEVIKKIRKWVGSQGGIVYKLHGSEFMPSGFPDLIVLLYGQPPRFVEAKRPGEKPTPIQEARMDEIRAHGGIAFWCDSLEDFIEKLSTPPV